MVTTVIRVELLMRVVTLTCLLALVSLTPPASAAPYQPLDKGLRWVYGPPDAADRDTIISLGDTVFDGLEVVQFEYHGFNEGLLNFWSLDADGSVLFHGFDRPDVPFTVHYVPPLRMVVPPVVVAQTWRDTIQSLCLRGCEADTTPTIFAYTVNSIGSHSVPAGAFEAAAIDMGLGFAELKIPHGYTMFGEKARGAIPLVTQRVGQVRWWSEGVGMIENYYGWRLLVFDTVTATRVMSWGQLKSRYR